MKKVGRNDPCPCGSGKKYKQCCLRAEEAQRTRAADDRSNAVPRALQWLMSRHGRSVRQALDEGFFGTLDDEQYERLQDEHTEAFQGILVNAMEWLLSEASLLIRGQAYRVAELLLGRGGPLFSAEQRQWLERLTSTRLGLYEVADVVPGESLLLKDILFPQQAPVLVRERTGSRDAVKLDLIAARILPVDEHHELSGAVYTIPRHRSFDLIAELRHELQGLAPNDAEVKEVLSVIIPAYWLQWFIRPFEIPQIVDHSTGEPLLLITDYYRVENWVALEQALSAEADIEGSHSDGWARLFEGTDGLLRSRLSIDPGRSRPDWVQVSYRTQKYADEGRPWFEAVAGAAAVFVSREIVDPKGRLSQLPPGEVSETAATAKRPPEGMGEVIEERIRQLYADWADQPLPALDGRTPREAIQTSEGLEQVKFLLHTYEHGEIRQAKTQQRPAVSYEFLWRELGIAP
jgi:SEC-C motif/Antitoxin Xre/MbcA/ParS C-terminal toxin-binding domain